MQELIDGMKLVIAIDCPGGCFQDGSEEDDGNSMDDDSLSDWNLSK